MGSNKRLVLAALVSVMMVLAFIVGFVPSQNPVAIRADAGDGSVDMVDLLNQVLDLKALDTLAIAAPASGSTIIVPDGKPDVPVALEVDANELADIEDVTYWIDADWDIIGGAPVTASPFAVNWVANYFQYALGAHSLFASATSLSTGNAVAAPAVNFTLAMANDTGGNGIPDNPFATVGADSRWVDRIEAGPSGNPVYLGVINLEQSTGLNPVVFTFPGGRVTAPSLAALAAANLVYAANAVYEDSNALLLVKAASDLNDIVDSTSVGTPADWANDAQGKADVLGSTLARFVEISIVYDYRAKIGGLGGYTELENLGAQQVVLELNNVVLPGTGSTAEMYAFPTFIGDGVNGMEVQDELGVTDWALVTGSDEAYMATSTLSVFAPISQITYALNMSVSPVCAGTTMPAVGSSLVDANSVQILSATPAGGYTFVEWLVNGVSQAGNLLVMDGDKDVVAVFDGPLCTPRTLTLSASPVEGGTVAANPGDMVYEDGTVVTVTATANPGYEFVQWTVDGTPINGTNVTDITMDADLAVIAEFQLITYTLTTNFTPVDAPAVILRDNAGPDYLPGTVVNLEATLTMPGLIFIRWTGDVAAGTETDNPVAVTMDSDKSVTAVFEAPLVTVTTVSEPLAGGTIALNPAGPDFPRGTQVEVTATANTGYEWLSWLQDGVPIDAANPATITVNANTTMTAVFGLVGTQYTLTTAVTPDGSGTVTRDPDATQYAPGTQVTLTAAPVGLGLFFMGWVGAEAGHEMDNPLVVTMDADKSLTATFGVPRYTLTTGVLPEGSASVTVDPDQPDYAAGSNVTLTATANLIGLFFSHWQNEAGQQIGVANPLILQMTSDRTAIAVFTPPIYDLTINVTGNGTTVPAPGVLDRVMNTVLPVEAIAAPGNVFTGWLGPVANPASASTTVTFSGPDQVITATFAPIMVSLTLLTDGNGTAQASPAGPNYPIGSVVTLTATPAAGNVFAGWTGGVVNPLNELTDVLMTDDKTVTAHFLGEDVPQSFSVAVTPIGGGRVTGPGGVPLLSSYPAGTEVEVVATADPGFVFVRWEVTEPAKQVVDTVEDPNDPSTTVWVNGNKIVTAVFAEAAITPDRAWLFGGVLAEITLTGVADLGDAAFTADTTVVFRSTQLTDDIPATIIVQEADRLVIEVPALTDQGGEATIAGNMVLNQAVKAWDGEALVPFTYYRYDVQGDVVYTAFVRAANDGTAIDRNIDVLEVGGAAFDASVSLPVPTNYRGSDVFGLVRTSLTPAALLTDKITNAAEGRGPETLVPSLWDFDIHLYTQVAGWSAFLEDPTMNTPPSLVGNITADAKYLNEIDWAYERGVDAPGVLGFQVPSATGMTHATLRNGLSLWSWYDYKVDYSDLTVTENTNPAPA
ncbi:MAG: large repetitive protein, partial [Candidatus Hydrogenedentes bacterium]|nr:large repetitive protein [Candidatus Hydrogenedentota bacterium]